MRILPLAFLVFSAASALGQSPSTLYTYNGGSQLGTSVSGVGDVDSDGFDDFVIVEPNVGVRVHSGKTGALLRIVTSTASAMNVAGCGDINKDGIPDFVMGGNQYGKVVSGVDGSTLFAMPTGVLANSVAGAGDTNADGFLDVVVGYPATIFPNNNGMAWTLSGKTGAVLKTLLGITVQFPDFGSAVCSAGDADGDGYSDVVVGAPGSSTNGLAHNGYMRIHSGKTGALLRHIDGTEAWGIMGRPLAFLGDACGDDQPRVLVGMPRGWTAAAPEIHPPGRALEISAMTGAVLRSWNGEEEFDGFGSALAAAGDVNGDGATDIIVGARSQDVTAVDVQGNYVRVLCGKTGGSLFKLTGSVGTTFGDYGDGFGRAVSGAGDVNHDGFADVIVGAPDAPVGLGSSAGYVKVYGGLSILPSAPSVARVSFKVVHFGSAPVVWNEATIDGWLADVSTLYRKAANLEFAKVDFVHLWLPEWFDVDLGGSSADKMEELERAAEANPVAYGWRTDAINVYLLNSRNNPDIGGAASFPIDTPSQNDVIILSGELLASAESHEEALAHELGHYFGLLHTFETSFGAETQGLCLAKSPNGAAAGDFVLDTPADPYDGAKSEAQNLAALQALYPASSCAQLHDAVRFNVMSYYSGIEPWNWVLTCGQAQKVIKNLDARSHVLEGAAKPTITGFSPASATYLGPTTVTITGSHFPASGLSVFAGYQEATGLTWTDSVIVASFDEPLPPGKHCIGVVQNGQLVASTADGTAPAKTLDVTPLSKAYGTGTAGCDGFHALTLDGAPLLDTSPVFRCDHAPPTSSAVVGLGLISNVSDEAGSELFGLGVLLHVDLVTATFSYTFNVVSQPDGSAASAPVSIPLDYAFLDRTFYAQVLFLWPAGSCSPSPFKLSTSNGVAFTIALTSTP